MQAIKSLLGLFLHMKRLIVYGFTSNRILHIMDCTIAGHAEDVHYPNFQNPSVYTLYSNISKTSQLIS